MKAYISCLQVCTQNKYWNFIFFDWAIVRVSRRDSTRSTNSPKELPSEAGSVALCHDVSVMPMKRQVQ